MCDMYVCCSQIYDSEGLDLSLCVYLYTCTVNNYCQHATTYSFTDRARHPARGVHQAHALRPPHRVHGLRRYVVRFILLVDCNTFHCVLLYCLCGNFSEDKHVHVSFQRLLTFNHRPYHPNWYSHSYSHTALHYAERDPRRKQVLEEPRPNVSFVLCQVNIRRLVLYVCAYVYILRELNFFVLNDV